jgi:hypothetical protein
MLNRADRADTDPVTSLNSADVESILLPMS